MWSLPAIRFLKMQLLCRTRNELNCIGWVPIFLSSRLNAYNKNDELKNTQGKDHPTCAQGKQPVLGDMGSKYKQFKNEESEIILDVYEERLKYANFLEEEEVDKEDKFVGLNLERGKTGVFDIEDLIEVLKHENAEDIFVASVPNEIKYVDYMVIVSGKSQRHMQALAQFVRRVFKQKRHKADQVPRLEGADSKDWMAMDLGNIALHILSKKARIHYDLDSLWALGAKFDKEFNKKEPLSELLEQHSMYLGSLEAAT